MLPPRFASVQLGETVEVQTQDATRRFVVKEIDRDALVSVEGVRYTRAEFLELKRQTLSAGKTTGLTVGLLYVFGVILGRLL